MVVRKVRTAKRRTLASDRFLGLPGSWTFPGWPAVWKNMWDTSANAKLFPPKVWGFGWSFNFGYAHIRSKPLAKRIGAFLIGFLFILLLAYALVAVSMLTYFVVTTRFA